jgi:hypothetical protein
MSKILSVLFGVFGILLLTISVFGIIIEAHFTPQNLAILSLSAFAYAVLFNAISKAVSSDEQNNNT